MSMLTRAVSAELVRQRHSNARRLTLIGLAICVMAGGSWLIVGRSATPQPDQWQQLLRWHVLYVTGLSAVMMALLAGLTVRRDQLARSGGTPWRATPLRVVNAARLLVLSASSLVLNLLTFLPILAFGWVQGWSLGPLGRLLELTAIVWAANLGILTMCHALAHRYGMYAALAVGGVWQVAGSLFAESTTWWAQPWTWGVRPALPLIGTHQNGIPLEAGAALYDVSPWPCVLLGLLLAVVSAACSGNEKEARHGRMTVGEASRPHRVTGSTVVNRGAGKAVMTGLRHTAILPLSVLSVLALVAVTAIYPASYLRGFYGLLLLPLGTALLSILAWGVTSPAWRSLATHRQGPDRLIRWVQITLIGFVFVMSTIVAVLSLLDGSEVGTTLRGTAVSLCLGTTLIQLALWLTCRFHPGVALAVSALGLGMGLVFGGSVLANTVVWIAGPYGWASSAADSTGRAALACTISVTCSVLLFFACRAAARRYAALT